MTTLESLSDAVKEALVVAKTSLVTSEEAVKAARLSFEFVEKLDEEISRLKLTCMEDGTSAKASSTNLLLENNFISNELVEHPVAKKTAYTRPENIYRQFKDGKCLNCKQDKTDCLDGTFLHKFMKNQIGLQIRARGDSCGVSQGFG